MNPSMPFTFWGYVTLSKKTLNKNQFCTNKCDQAAWIITWTCGPSETIPGDLLGASVVARFTWVLGCVAPSALLFLSPNLTQITDKGNFFFSNSCLIFYTYSFCFSHFRVSKNLSTRTHESSKGHVGIFGPPESPKVFQSPTWLPPPDGMLCGVERTFCSLGEWAGMGKAYPLLSLNFLWFREMLFTPACVKQQSVTPRNWKREDL